MTTEMFKVFQERVIAFCDAKYKNGDPHRIELLEDGTFCAVWEGYNRDYDNTNEYFTAEDITTDLDIIVKERNERLINEAIEAEKRRKEINAKYEKDQKEKRLIEYNKLKREFEG